MKIAIEFVDGPYDGTVSFDDSEQSSPDPYKFFAQSFYLRTKGIVGWWGGGLSPANQQRLMQQSPNADLSHATHHEYHVTESQESGDGLHIRAKYTTVPRGDETATFVVRHIEEAGRIKLGLLGLPVPERQYRDGELVTVHTSIYQFRFGPPPDRETPLTGKKATWNGEEYRIEKATIEEWTVESRTGHMATLVLTPMKD